MTRYHIHKCPGTLRDEHTIYDTKEGRWFHSHVWRNPLWTPNRDRAHPFPSFSDAAAVVDRLEAAGDKAIEKAANVMTQIVKELVIVAFLIVAACAVAAVIRVIGQFVWGW